ncbi:YojF family protein [Paenibacillus sp. N1-5-1-14]|uniref:YojF family protein n=1 Tax=Paenibacillus radicibacter TaxID=2972488 RepID=UPI0021594FA5|nr:YojF family protein [Paenibacillus radicibacter]MCR8644634.1 YojF family protein [Paenibacillus radicibacter]
MELIQQEIVQQAINSYANQDVYLHLETTNGAYASHNDDKKMTVGAYIRNGLVQFTSGSIAGEHPYRAGLKLAFGWIYAEGLTHYEIDDLGRLLLAGYDDEGRLAVALELSHKPF